MKSCTVQQFIQVEGQLLKYQASVSLVLKLLLESHCEQRAEKVHHAQALQRHASTHLYTTYHLGQGLTAAQAAESLFWLGSCTRKPNMLLAQQCDEHWPLTEMQTGHE